MSNAVRHTAAFDAFAFDREAVRSAARRQFSLSVAVAVALTAFAAIGLTRSAPDASVSADAGHHGVAAPIFATPSASHSVRIG
jgi:hypothetical protein